MRLSILTVIFQIFIFFLVTFVIPAEAEVNINTYEKTKTLLLAALGESNRSGLSFIGTKVKNKESCWVFLNDVNKQVAIASKENLDYLQDDAYIDLSRREGIDHKIFFAAATNFQVIQSSQFDYGDAEESTNVSKSVLKIKNRNKRILASIDATSYLGDSIAVSMKNHCSLAAASSI